MDLSSLLFINLTTGAIRVTLAQLHFRVILFCNVGRWRSWRESHCEPLLHPLHPHPVFFIVWTNLFMALCLASLALSFLCGHYIHSFAWMPSPLIQLNNSSNNSSNSFLHWRSILFLLNFTIFRAIKSINNINEKKQKLFSTFFFFLRFIGDVNSSYSLNLMHFKYCQWNPDTFEWNPIKSLKAVDVAGWRISMMCH